MLNRKVIFSLIAVAAVSMAATVTVNSAYAVPKGPGAFKGNPGKGGGGGAWPGKGPGGKGPGVIVPPGPKGPGPKGPGPGAKGPGFKPHWCFKHPWHCRSGHIHIVRYPVVTTRVATVSRPVASTCTCLTKTYLPNGAVMFKDVCTQEVAINGPEQQAQAQ